MRDTIYRDDAIDAVYKASGTGGALKALKRLPPAEPENIRCKDCKYSVDEYKDGDCYCKRPSHELVWIGENWDFFCAAARKKGGA